MLIGSALLGAIASCGALSNPQTPPPPAIPPSSPDGLLVILTDFDAHVGEQLDMRLVGGDGTVLSVIRLAPLHEADYRIELVRVPKKPNMRVDLLFDNDGDGVHEPESESAWSHPVNSVGSVAFVGTTPETGALDPAQPGGDFQLHFTGFAALEGEVLRLALLNPANQITGPVHRHRVWRRIYC